MEPSSRKRANAFRRESVLRRFFLIASILVSAGSQAEEIFLFESSGKPAQNYRDLIWNLARNDLRDQGKILVFPAGHRFRVLERLGDGGTTLILKVTPLEPKTQMPEIVALRVSNSADGSFFLPQLSQRAWLYFYSRTYPRMLEYGVDVPEIYLEVPGQFIALELIEKTFDLETFLKRPESIPDLQRQRAEIALMIFADGVARLSQIMDFKAIDLVYEDRKNRWVLLDYTGIVELGWRRNGNRDHPFGDAFEEAYFHSFHPFTGKKSAKRAPTPWEREILDRVDAIIRRRRSWMFFVMPLRSCSRALIAGKGFRLRAPPEIEKYLA